MLKTCQAWWPYNQSKLIITENISALYKLPGGWFDFYFVVPFLFDKPELPTKVIFHSYFFLCVCVGSELLYSNCSLDCLTYIYLFYFECKDELSFEEHLSIIA